MTFLYVLVPVAILLVIIAIWVFTWAVNNGQYDDLDGPAHSILFDDEDPAHLAAQKGEEQDKDDQPPTAAQQNDPGAEPADQREPPRT
ncbi:cbb3-type cytochrome oxidase assembly protein CcoS [Halopseudomonas nanhaiensis]|uniref:cbb3-type cytochrome oxidase assembly protein CcoS n=1 Tax=Halopseudomonas nanhaiensis TaxID=2830842 RepID=UPI001CBACE4D|nr:cbb3-type cytochrome oxidase assembly protein CcoS [Halopseudomonas nanhaiensis]UAW97302.1 cbb3-type cytochrome oxidase assembly protein CcoS [Halopseudomonas nanhaiensis]